MPTRKSRPFSIAAHFPPNFSQLISPDSFSFRPKRQVVSHRNHTGGRTLDMWKERRSRDWNKKKGVSESVRVPVREKERKREKIEENQLNLLLYKTITFRFVPGKNGRNMAGGAVGVDVSAPSGLFRLCSAFVDWKQHFFSNYQPGVVSGILISVIFSFLCDSTRTCKQSECHTHTHTHTHTQTCIYVKYGVDI